MLDSVKFHTYKNALHYITCISTVVSIKCHIAIFKAHQAFQHQNMIPQLTKLEVGILLMIISNYMITLSYYYSQSSTWHSYEFECTHVL